MQEKRSIITAGQLFSLLFVARAVIMITINTVLAGGGRMVDNLVSCAASLVLSFVFIVPIWLLQRRDRSKNVLEHAYSISKILGVIAAVFYSIYFILVDSYYLSFFEIFFSNVIDETLPLWIVAAGVMILAAYAGLKGLQAIARTAVFGMVLICAGVLFIVASLAPKMDSMNYEPLFFNGAQQSITGVFLFLGRSTGFASMALVLPQVRGKIRRGFSIWNVGVYLLMALVLIVMVGALGNYMNNQLFPVYTASQVASAGVLENLDAIFTGVWVSGLFIKVSFDLYLIFRCVAQAVHKTAGKYAVIAAAAFIGVFSILISDSHRLQTVFYGPYLLFPATALAGFLIPLLILLVQGIQKRRKKHES